MARGFNDSFNPITSSKTKLVEVVNRPGEPNPVIYSHTARHVSGNFITVFSADGLNWVASETIEAAREAKL